MKTEFEAKFFPIDKIEIRAQLKKIGAQLILPERLMKRTIFDHHLNPAIEADYIRVRDEGDKVRLSVKVHAKAGGKVEDQKELDVIVSNYDATVELLQKAGLKISHFQETLRETWHFDDAEIVIDTWPGLSPYIEIEGISEEKVKEIAELLGQKWESKKITSIVEIFAEVYGVSNQEALKKIAYITFEKPFKY